MLCKSDKPSIIIIIKLETRALGGLWVYLPCVLCTALCLMLMLMLRPRQTPPPTHTCLGALGAWGNVS